MIRDDRELIKSIQNDKNINKKDLHNKQLTRFLSSIFYFNENDSLSKNVSFSIFKKGEEGIFDKESYSLRKIMPKRKNSNNLAKSLLNIADKDFSIIFGISTLGYSNANRTEYKNGVSSVIIDIDNSFAKNVKELFSCYSFLNILKPSWVIQTSENGFHVYYCFKSVIKKNNNEESIYTAICNILATMLRADKKHLGFDGRCRLPFSLNHKSGFMTNIVYEGCVYNNFDDLKDKVLDCTKNTVVDVENGIFMQKQDLLEEYEMTEDELKENYGDRYKKVVDLSLNETNSHNFFVLENKKRKVITKTVIANSVHRKSLRKDDDEIITSTYASKVPSFLRKLLSSRSGLMKGYRNECLFVLASARKISGIKEDQIFKEVYYFNSRFAEPLSDNEVRNIVKSAAKKPCLSGYVSLGEKLNITKDECVFLNENRFLGVQYVCEYEKQRRKENAKKQKEKRQYSKRKEEMILECFSLLKKTNNNISKVAKKMGKTRNTIYNWMKEYPTLTETDKTKTTARKELVEQLMKKEEERSRKYLEGARKRAEKIKQNIVKMIQNRELETNAGTKKLKYFTNYLVAINEGIKEEAKRVSILYSLVEKILYMNHSQKLNWSMCFAKGM